MHEKSIDSVSVFSQGITILVRISLLVLGTFIQLKIIPICKRERDKVWQINITRSVALMPLMIFAFLFETLTDHVPEFSQYTGVSICYIAAFVYVYFPLLIAFDSLIVSLMRYIFIVHQEKSIKYGEDKIKIRFFWFNLIHPFLIAMPTVLIFDFEAFASVITCFGLEDKLLERYNSSTGNLERMFLCKLRITDGEDLGTHIFYTLIQGFCATKMVYVWGLSGNILEAYFYYKIFKKMRR